MAATYEPIATTTLGSNQATVAFNSIPSTYTDLVVVVNGRTARSNTGDQIMAYFNADNSTSNYSWTYLIGNGSSAASGRITGGSEFAMIGTVAGNTASSGVLGLAIANIQNYSNTTTKKTILARGNTASDETQAAVSLWQGTAAISSITFSSIADANILSGTTITLYGIKAA